VGSTLTPAPLHRWRGVYWMKGGFNYLTPAPLRGWEMRVSTVYSLARPSLSSTCPNRLISSPYRAQSPLRWACIALS
jgi:hypothetical protein